MFSNGCYKLGLCGKGLKHPFTGHGSFLFKQVTLAAQYPLYVLQQHLLQEAVHSTDWTLVQTTSLEEIRTPTGFCSPQGSKWPPVM